MESLYREGNSGRVERGGGATLIIMECPDVYVVGLKMYPL